MKLVSVVLAVSLLVAFASAPAKAAAYSDDEALGVYILGGLLVVGGAYWLATDAFVEKDPHYVELKNEIKANGVAGEGEIKAQIQKRVDAAREADGEAEAWESMNAQLEARLAAANAAVAFWAKLVDEDRRFISEKEREDAARKARLAAARPYGGGPTVYVTATGSKYHRAGCRYLRKSAYPMSKGDAIAAGYSP